MQLDVVNEPLKCKPSAPSQWEDHNYEWFYKIPQQVKGLHYTKNTSIREIMKPGTGTGI